LFGIKFLRPEIVLEHMYMYIIVKLFAANHYPSLGNKKRQEKKGMAPSLHFTSLHSMKRLLIGCMEILFLKLGTTIFGLD
jgi:hypothetical protein